MSKHRVCVISAALLLAAVSAAWSPEHQGAADKSENSETPPRHPDLAEGYWAGPGPPRMVFVPSGTFIMGDGEVPCGSDERQVTLTRDFWLGQYEVTNAQYRALLQWAYNRGYVTADSSSVRDNLDGSTEKLLDLDDNGSEFAFSDGVFSLREADLALEQAYPHGYDPSNHPVIEVSWYGAVSYCDWLSLGAGLSRAYDHSTWLCGGGDPYSAEGYRLLTDAEWEYGAQWNDERIHPWGDESPQECVHANYAGCVGWTSPVGSYPAGAQPNLSGPIHDMIGNVREWCNDWYECDLGNVPETNPIGPPNGDSRVSRAGNWGSYGFIALCASSRTDYPPFGCSPGYGFRIARSEP